MELLESVTARTKRDHWVLGLPKHRWYTVHSQERQVWSALNSPRARMLLAISNTALQNVTFCCERVLEISIPGCLLLVLTGILQGAIVE